MISFVIRWGGKKLHTPYQDWLQYCGSLLKYNNTFTMAATLFMNQSPQSNNPKWEWHKLIKAKRSNLERESSHKDARAYGFLRLLLHPAQKITYCPEKNYRPLQLKKEADNMLIYLLSACRPICSSNASLNPLPSFNMSSLSAINCKK